MNKSKNYENKLSYAAIYASSVAPRYDCKASAIELASIEGAPL